MILYLQQSTDTNHSIVSHPSLCLGEWGQDLIEKERGIYSAAAAKLIDDEAELKMPATPSRNMKPPTNRLASPRLIYDHYSKKYRFTRDETCTESEECLKKLDESMKKQLCKDECLINSIRSRLFKLSRASLRLSSPQHQQRKLWQRQRYLQRVMPQIYA